MIPPIDLWSQWKFHINVEPELANTGESLAHSTDLEPVFLEQQNSLAVFMTPLK